MKKRLLFHIHFHSMYFMTLPFLVFSYVWTFSCIIIAVYIVRPLLLPIGLYSGRLNALVMLEMSRMTPSGIMAVPLNGARKQ